MSNHKGNIALNYAVKKDKNLGVIKELLEYGADINIRNREFL
ncbi:MAG: ankyrin repeat domain-containing protein [Wolbachia sp.]